MKLSRLLAYCNFTKKYGILFLLFISTVTSYSQDTLRVLAIGNSFSRDGVENYLIDLAMASGKKLIIGNMVIGGAPLSLHYNHAVKNNNAYEYTKIAPNGRRCVEKKVSIATALHDEKWDFVSLQQASPLSGRYDSIQSFLPLLHSYLDSATQGKVKIAWHQTWAYESTSTHPGFAYYKKDQRAMYDSIMQASNQLRSLVPISLLIPSGTAIQNARFLSPQSDLTRDGYHLSLQFGRFIAACTWFEAIFKIPAPVHLYKPDDLSKEEAQIALKASHEAIKKPFTVLK